jgi:hypothetical protein
MRRDRRMRQPRRPEVVPDPWLLSKYDAPCCTARVDAYGRFPVGYCGPECERRSGRFAK